MFMDTSGLFCVYDVRDRRQPVAANHYRQAQQIVTTNFFRPLIRFTHRSFRQRRALETNAALPQKHSDFIIAPMSNSSSPLWADQFTFRLDRQDPYLRLLHVTVFVRDQDRSLRFYVDQLGFNLVADNRFEGGGRWVAVAPPDGTAVLALVTPDPHEEEYKLIGQSRQVVFVTEDIAAKFHDWSKRGVRFHHPPHTPDWGGMFTSFEDPDGNRFAIVGFDEMTRDIEAKRRAIAEELESERRAAQELQIAKQVQARLFPQMLPPLRTLDYAGICIQARQVGGDYYDFLDLGRERLGLVIGDITLIVARCRGN